MNIEGIKSSATNVFAPIKTAGSFLGYKVIELSQKTWEVAQAFSSKVWLLGQKIYEVSKPAFTSLVNFLQSNIGVFMILLTTAGICVERSQAVRNKFARYTLEIIALGITLSAGIFAAQTGIIPTSLV